MNLANRACSTAWEAVKPIERAGVEQDQQVGVFSAAIKGLGTWRSVAGRGRRSNRRDAGVVRGERLGAVIGEIFLAEKAEIRGAV